MSIRRHFFLLPHRAQRVGRVLALLCLVSGTRLAEAQSGAEPPLLFGGPQNRPPRQPPPIDPLLPTGPPTVPAAERPADGVRACSFVRPVCVHPARGVSNEAALGALGALESSWERLVLALGL